MRAIDTFRFTSQDRTALDQVAALYGGDVHPWADPKAAPGQFEVITDASVIPIALPPDPLGGTPSYELWGGGGRARNCDGVTCEMLVQGSDGIDLQQTDCICWSKGVRECQLTTRLSVLLTEVRFIGVWRIDTKSDNAAKELPGMVELVQSLQSKGLTRAILRIESRRQVVAGQTRQFKVPVLGVDETVEALAAGAARLGSIGAYVPMGEIESGEVGDREAPRGDSLVVQQVESLPCPSPDSNLDDVIVDAEVVEEPAGAPQPPAPPPSTDNDCCSVCGGSVKDGRPITRGGAEQSKWVHVEHASAPVAEVEPMTEPQSKRLHAALRTIGVVGPARHTWATEHLGRSIESFSALTKDEANRMIDLLEREVVAP